MPGVSSLTETIQAPLRVIGVGTFGVVFEVPGTAILAIKKTLNGPALAYKLIDEFNFGRDIQQTFYSKAVGIFKNEPDFQDLVLPRVPSYMCCFGAIKADGKHLWWQQNGKRFPSIHGYDKAGPIFCFERIPAITKGFRSSLIKQFFPDSLVEAALKNPDNDDALIRPYLGHSWKDLSAEQRRHGRDSLRNFPLYVDELKELGLKPNIIAREMALALATAHWSVSIDLFDSEFVIGSRPAYSQDLRTFLDASLHLVDKTTSLGQEAIDIIVGEDSLECSSSRNPTAQLWLVDFDKCARFAINHKTAKADIQDLVRRTRTNDPYYPSSIPASELEWTVWQAFRSTYILASRALLKHKIMEATDLWDTIEIPQKAILDRPKEVMLEWYNQEKAAMDSEEFDRRKAVAIQEGYITLRSK